MIPQEWLALIIGCCLLEMAAVAAVLVLAAVINFGNISRDKESQGGNE